MMQKFQEFCDILSKVPADAYAILLVFVGALLVCLHHSEQGMAIITAGTAIFRGRSNSPSA